MNWILNQDFTRKRREGRDYSMKRGTDAQMLRGEGKVSTQGFMECLERTLHFPVPFEIQHLNVTIFEQLIMFLK